MVVALDTVEVIRMVERAHAGCVDGTQSMPARKLSVWVTSGEAVGVAPFGVGNCFGNEGADGAEVEGWRFDPSQRVGVGIYVAVPAFHTETSRPRNIRSRREQVYGRPPDRPHGVVGE
jgi:hypothetical protein